MIETKADTRGDTSNACEANFLIANIATRVGGIRRGPVRKPLLGLLFILPIIGLGVPATLAARRINALTAAAVKGR